MATNYQVYNSQLLSWEPSAHERGFVIHLPPDSRGAYNLEEHEVITARVRSTTGRYCFHRCLSVHRGGGGVRVPPPPPPGGYLTGYTPPGGTWTPLPPGQDLTGSPRGGTWTPPRGVPDRVPPRVPGPPRGGTQTPRGGVPGPPRGYLTG